MARARTAYACTECGGRSSKWQGQCPHCAAWNTLVETVAVPAATRFTAVAGAIGDASFQGEAYVFERNVGGAENWGQVKELTASDGAATDWMSCVVRLKPTGRFARTALIAS